MNSIFAHIHPFCYHQSAFDVTIIEKSMKKMIHKVLQYPDAKHIIVSGDIHGGFTRVVFKLCMQNGCTDTLLIIAGDCGFGFEKLGYYERIYNKVAGQLRKANNWVVFLRGNHDDPSYFSEEKDIL